MKEYKVKVFDNRTEWYLGDVLHREDGPAIEYTDGRYKWFLNGKIHREDGPAIVQNGGYKEWWINGKLHREDGPAIEWYNGDKSWYLNDEECSEADFLAKTRQSKELTIAEIEKLLGHQVKIIK